MGEILQFVPPEEAKIIFARASCNEFGLIPERLANKGGIPICYSCGQPMHRLSEDLEEETKSPKIIRLSTNR
jgi:hypothetical protein